MQSCCPFVHLSVTPLVGNFKQSRQKSKDLENIVIPEIKTNKQANK